MSSWLPSRMPPPPDVLAARGSAPASRAPTATENSAPASALSSSSTPSSSSPSSSLSIGPGTLALVALGSFAAGGAAYHAYRLFVASSALSSSAAAAASTASSAPSSLLTPRPLTVDPHVASNAFSIMTGSGSPTMRSAGGALGVGGMPSLSLAPTAPTIIEGLPNAVIVVDPVSTGANLAFEINKRGTPVIRVASGYVSPALLNFVDDTIRTEFVATVAHDSADPVKTIQQLRALPVNIIACVSGSELGIEVTDWIAQELGVPNNGTSLTNARRDKYQMGECVRRNGVRAVKQARVQSWPECEQFLDDLRPNPFKVVLKPIRSSGSDNVYLCESREEAKERFLAIIGRQNQLGFVNDAVVIQEYLEGPEFVVDTVSRNGVHKVVALWKYDKRQFQGFNFVYFGMCSVSGKSEEGRALAAYIPKVLDALNIKDGAGHAEVILTRNGPCLVEVGARCHGGEGTFMPVGDRCWGYNQVSALTMSILAPEEFAQLPAVCGDMKEFGLKIDLVSNVAGKLKRLHHMDEIRALPSYVREDLLPRVGDRISVTIDCFTAVGCISLIHVDPSVVLADHERVREFEKTMFEVEA